MGLTNPGWICHIVSNRDTIHNPHRSGNMTLRRIFRKYPTQESCIEFLERVRFGDDPLQKRAKKQRRELVMGRRQ